MPSGGLDDVELMDNLAFEIHNSDGNKRINTYLENNKHLNLNETQIRFQAHFLTERDDEDKNILHLACMRGLDEAIKFFVEKAFAFGLLDLIINAKDNQGLTPLYYYCLFGFSDDKRAISRCTWIKILVKGPEN